MSFQSRQRNQESTLVLLKALTEYLMIQVGVLRAIARLGAEALDIEKRTDIGKKEGYLSNPTSALAYFLRRLSTSYT